MRIAVLVTSPSTQRKPGPLSIKLISFVARQRKFECRHFWAVRMLAACPHGLRFH